MIRIDAIETAPLAVVRYLNATSGGGTSVERLQIVRAHIGPLADPLDAIVCCSDLQGVVRGDRGLSELLGVAVAEQLDELADARVLPPAARTGILLAGDLYSVPAANQRGGFGDVSTVWQAFADRFAWVAGVAGNHDDVSLVPELGENVHLLDGTHVTLDGVRIGGVGGIISAKQKPGRRPEAEQLRLLDRVVDANVDIVVLHEGPHGEAKQVGNAAIRDTLEAGDVRFTVCGHAHWADPLARHATGQILNVDARVIVLVAAR